MKTQLYSLRVVSKPIAACVFALAVILTFAGVSRGADYLPLKQIVPGMKGYGLTVFKGTKITSFPVQIIGVVPNDGPGGEETILVRVSGPEIEASGGIALGMSGSPVYVNGKLVGAISTTFPDTDHMIGGVTPIEQMFHVGAMKNKMSRAGTHAPVRIAGREWHAVRLCATGCQNDASAGVLAGRPALAPVAISGVGERAYQILRKDFLARGVDVLPRNVIPSGQMPAQSEIGRPTPIAPGSAVAIQLVRGPIDISAIGTVTAVEKNRLYAFGHPFFHRGAVEYLMADAYVHATVPGTDMPFKIASPGRIRGTFTEDRGSAISGVQNVYPKLVPLNITVEDKDTSVSRTFRMRIVRDRDLMRDLVVTVLLEALDQTVDRVGPGTSHVAFTVDANGYSGPTARTNMFYSSDDISSESLTDITNLMEIITQNKLRDTEMRGLDVRATVDCSRSVATIEKAEIADESATGTAAGTATDTAQPANPDAMKDPAGTDDHGTDPEEMSSKSFPSKDSKKPEPDKFKRNKLRFRFPIGEQIEPRLPTTTSGTTGENEVKVFRGQKVQIKVTLHPFRADTVDEILYLKVPDDIALGAANIDVFSGTKFLPPTEPGNFIININVENPQPRDKDRELHNEKKSKTIDEIVNDFFTRDRNNELVATISSLTFTSSDNKDEKKSDDEDDDATPQKQRARKSTRWVLDGSTSIRVRVEDRTTMKERGIRKSHVSALDEPEDSGR